MRTTYSIDRTEINPSVLVLCNTTDCKISRAVLYFCRCNHILGFQIILHPVCLLKCHSVLYSMGTDPAFNLMLDYKFHVYFPSFPAFFLPCLPRSDSLAKGKIEVPVLDATAIGVSMFRGDIATAGSVMFLLGIGEILEEWTHKKSVGDLARSMSLNISKVWLVSDGQEVLVPFSSVKSGDMVRIHMGNVIPFDGTSILPFASVRTPIQRYFTDFTAVIHALTEYGKNNLFP